MATYTTLFLDLDDTLYPTSSGLWEAIKGRIDIFLIRRMGMAPETASRLRQRYLVEYGTTLNGLVAEHQVDPYEYLAFVHDLPVEKMLRPDPALRDLLARLPQRRVVLTNADRAHAQRVLNSLGIRSCIDLVIDILELEMVNKPQPQAYLRAMQLAGELRPDHCVLVDDRQQNLVPAHELGIVTVLVGAEQPQSDGWLGIRSITELPEALPDLLRPQAGGNDG
jgi:putative hydrolase of the HAD superfamily